MTQILKKHVGRPLDFFGSAGQRINGRVEAVRNGIATVRYWTAEGVPHSTEGYTAYLEVRSPRVVEVY